MSIMDNFDQWKDFLGDRLNQAQDKGMQQDTINNLAYEIGEHLAFKVDAKTMKKQFFVTFGMLLPKKKDVRWLA